MMPRTTVAPKDIRPALTATKDQLMAAYRQQATAIHSLRATVEITLSGSTYSSVIKQYPHIGGVIYAEQPDRIRLIGEAPVVATNIFTMASDGQVFRILVPSRNEFLKGPTHLERPAKDISESLRPQHVVDTLFWPELRDDVTTIREENDSPKRYYVLMFLHGSGNETALDREVWFDRADLSVSRLEIYGPMGRLDADIAYSEWERFGATTATATAAASPGVVFPRQIHLARPQQGYELNIAITQLQFNQPIAPDAFTLTQPPGTVLVQLGEQQTASQPGTPSQ